MFEDIDIDISARHHSLIPTQESMATPNAGRKPKSSGRAKNDPRSLKRKRDVDDLESLQKAVDDLVCKTFVSRTQDPDNSNLGSQIRNKRILGPSFIAVDRSRPRSVAFQNPY
jgi:hypothetical protein